MQHIRDYRRIKVYPRKNKWPFPRWLRGLLTLFIFFFSFQYFQTKLYHFPDPIPFVGDSLYNPYEKLEGHWLKSNFHTHAQAWGGLTHGQQPGDEVIRAYQNSQYDIACVSDYLAINSLQDKRNSLYVPVYEHGINIQKAHRLAIGTEEVCYYDVIPFQNQSIKQYVIDRIKQKAPVVCIAHPSVQQSHSTDVLKNLSGYDCLEVLNRGRIATRHWDAALSAGKPVWILGNDDCHDITKSGFGNCWTMVHTDTSATEQVLRSLKVGKMYGVYNKRRQLTQEAWVTSTWPPRQDLLKEVTTNGSQVTIYLTQRADTIRLIGQNGVVKKEIYHSDAATYDFTPSDTYIRTEIICPEANYYLNPILRYKGEEPPQNYQIASTDVWLTFLWRYVIVVMNFLCVCIIFKEEISVLLHGQRRAFTYPIWVNH